MDHMDRDLGIQSQRLEIRPSGRDVVALELHARLHVPPKEHAIYSAGVKLEQLLAVGLRRSKLNVHSEGNHLASE